MSASHSAGASGARPSFEAWLAAGAVALLGIAEVALRRDAMTRGVSLLEIATSWIGNALGTPMEGVLQTAGWVTVVASVSTAILLRRSHPSAATTMLWVVVASHPILGANILLVELSAVSVIYAVARHAPRRAFITMGISIPIAAGVIVLLTKPNVWIWMLPADAERALWSSRALLFWAPMAAVLLVGGIPYLIGAYLRSRGEAAHSEAALVETRTELAETAEIARLRADQARLARDVHDVVGHSLAVIIAQAEAARLTGQLAPAGSAALSHITDIAREALHDVRAVLASTGDSAASVGGRVGELDELIEGVRSAGYPIDAQTTGRVQPLPPEIEAVAYRSLQEMLTNALRHGTAGYPVSVRQEWGDDVLIEVRNRAASAPSAASGGAGIPSMESRLASIGGELDVHLDGDDFIATARLPIRAAHA